jgi:VWFA-related protein
MTLRCLVLALAAMAAVQSQPTFRSGVDLIRLDASVLDADGRPVRDLRAEDFIVRIDGKPRAVSFARFYGPDAADERPQAALQEPASFAANTGAARGRVVVIVVDVDSMEPGYEKAVLDTAGALVDSLGPSDSVALLVITGKGIDLTRDHRRVRQALERLRGSASPNGLHEYAISVREAEAIGRGDGRTRDEVVERECLPTETGCAEEIIKVEAPQVLVEASRRIQSVLHTLSDLYARLKPIDMPRTVVLVSAGLPFRQESGGLFRDLQRRAAETGTMTYVVQLEQPETDATRATRPGAGSLPRTDLIEGLSTIAGVTGGAFRAGVGRALGVFDRMRTEIVHTYQLGVESVPADADGKVHKIDVEVRREGASVRARRELIVSNAPPRSRKPVDVLNLPPGLAEVPMSVAAYATLGEKPPALKVILLVETLGAASGSVPSYALKISNDDRAVFETADAMSPHSGGARAVIASQITPGRYWLRAGVVDAEGRAGSVELPLTIGLHRAGPLQCSDLIVGTAGDRFAPSTHIAVGTPVTALLELYATDPAQFSGISVDLELRAAGADAVLARAAASLNPTQLKSRRIADGRLHAPGLTPGTYVVSAIVRQDGKPMATIGRNIVRP